MISIRKSVSCGYILIFALIGMIIYYYQYEWKKLEVLEKESRTTDELRRCVNELNLRLAGFSLLGEIVLEWEDKNIANYHLQCMTLDSMFYYFAPIHPSRRVGSVCYLLEDREKQMRQTVQMFDEQKSIKERIARQMSEIAYKSTQEQPKKSKRKGFLGIFGKKEEAKPTAAITVLYFLNRNMTAE